MARSKRHKVSPEVERMFRELRHWHIMQRMSGDRRGVEIGDRTFKYRNGPVGMGAVQTSRVMADRIARQTGRERRKLGNGHYWLWDDGGDSAIIVEISVCHTEHAAEGES